MLRVLTWTIDHCAEIADRDPDDVTTECLRALKVSGRGNSRAQAKEIIGQTFGRVWAEVSGRWETVPKAAARFGVPQTWLRELIENGEVPALEMQGGRGGLYRVNTIELRRILLERQRAS